MNLFDKGKTGPHFIDSLQTGENVSWFYRVQEVVKKKTKNGDDFLDLTLVDKTGRLPAKIWNNVEEYHKLLRAGEVYKIQRRGQGLPGEKADHRQPPARGCRRRPGLRRPAISAKSPPFDSEALLAETFSLLAENLSQPHLLQLERDVPGGIRARLPPGLWRPEDPPRLCRRPAAAHPCAAENGPGHRPHVRPGQGIAAHRRPFSRYRQNRRIQDPAGPGDDPGRRFARPPGHQPDDFSGNEKPGSPISRKPSASASST